MTVARFENNNKNNVDLVLEPIKDDKLINEASIYELIKESEYNKLHVENSNIKNAIAELNSVLKPLQMGKKGREIRYQVLERRDASISVSIESDEMSAVAEITSALGGKHLSAKAILNAAQEAGVKKGFSKEQLVALAKHAAKEPPGSLVKGQIAAGKEPKNGRDAKIKPLVESAQSRILRPKERDDGSVDMRDLGDIICVKIGDPLAKKIPFTEGVEGYTVTGTPLSPEAGEDTALTPGNGTTISKADNNVLVSTLVGLPRAIDNGMEVDEVYSIKNVDVSTGHIDFDGSVIISGDVCEGMKVCARGDITVAGFVESAQLEAGGDITVSGGIIGRKHEVEEASADDERMSVHINASGNIFAKYGQYASITCRSLRIENQLMHSVINVKERLWLGTENKANGKLISGYITAGSSVHAGTVGATAGNATIVNFDHGIENFNARIEALEEKVQIESNKASELQAATKKLKALPKEKANKEVLAKVVSTYQFHSKNMGALLLEKESVEEELRNYMASVFIEATERMYQDVQLTVGDFKERTKREYGPSRMRYKERKIIIDPIVNG